MVDVLVVGAGPTGLTLASELLRRGLSVRIVDKAAAPSPLSRALAVHARTLEIFADFGIDETIIALFVSGGQYQTLTKRMFTALRDEIDPTIASISTLLTAASFILVLLATTGQKKAA